MNQAAASARMPIRVMCVDDNQLLGEAMQRQIEGDGRFEWTGWLGRTDELAQHVAQAQPNVLLLDIDMPGPDAFSLVPAVSEACPSTRVLMFSAYVRQDLTDRAIEAGVWGYISKNESLKDVLDAIERAAAGEFVLSSEAMGEQRLV